MTLTTERQQFAEQNEMSMDFVNWFFDEKKESFGNMWFLMAAALWEGWKGRANREAQPVAEPDYIRRDCGCCGFETLNDYDFHDGLVCPKCNHRPLGKTELYIAPPAPEVPEEMTGGIAMSKYKVKKSNYVQWVKGWNACRAAMLAQPVSSGYTFNSPVIPDGWIACSERMPELDKRVLLYFGSYDGHIEDGCIGDDGDGPYHYFFDGDSLQQEPTHWMPLPAAPEGGNDHNTRR